MRVETNRESKRERVICRSGVFPLGDGLDTDSEKDYMCEIRISSRNFFQGGERAYSRISGGDLKSGYRSRENKLRFSRRECDIARAQMRE